jgi:replication initiation protein RepC
MSAAQTSPHQVTGARRMTPTMLAARDRADGFAGLPRGTAKPLRLLAAFQEAEPYLGLPAHAFKLVSWLVRQTRPQDWEDGSRPIAWPSARRQGEFLGLSPARVKRLNRVLFEAAIFVIRDNEQGKRYGRRGADGRIIEAYGFDLSPLAQRHEEFIRLAAEARVERERTRALRGRVTRARRAIRQAGEGLAGLGGLPATWPGMEAATAALARAATRAERSEDLAVIVASLERRQAEAEQVFREAGQVVRTIPAGRENKPHTTSTDLAENPMDTVTAREACRPLPPSEPGPSGAVSSPVSAKASAPRAARPANGAEQPFRLKPARLLELAPRLGRYVSDAAPTWSAIVDAAGGSLRRELGVSPSLWGEACVVMGREQAAVALAIVSTKQPGYFTRGAGGYFAGMARKAARGELRLERSVWALTRPAAGPRAPGLPGDRACTT